jgi:ribosomal protein S27AE
VIRLGILFGIFVVALVVIRSRFVPESFGEFGHYRGDAVDAAASQEISYGGRELCVVCHDDHGDIVRTSYHRTLSCEVCHGPSAKHADEPDAIQPVIPRQRGEACLYCHQYLPSRPTGFPQIVERMHNPMEACVTCHDPHDPTPPEVPESCAACHNQIARTKAVSRHQTLNCETCHETAPNHRESPRANLPKKPTDRSFCGRCHATDARGPAEAPRIDLAEHGGRYLCWQCHYPHHPEGI